MISSSASSAGSKTLNTTQQQYKETEEIVENNPGIILRVTKLRTKISSNDTLKASSYERCYHTASFRDRAMATKWLNDKYAKDCCGLQFNYVNKAFVSDGYEVKNDR